MTKLDELIQELCPDGVKYLPIPELFITRNGYTPSKANNEFWENGTIPWFRMEDIRENGRILTTATQYVSEKAVKGKLFPADSIIIATSATIGEHALIKVPSLANQRFTYLTLKDEFKDCVDMMFVFYYSSLILSEEYFYVCRESLHLQLWVMRPTSVARWETPPSAAGGGYSEEGVCAAVEKIERANSAKIFSGTARGAKR